MNQRIHCRTCGAANLEEALLRAVIVCDSHGDEATAAICGDRRACRERVQTRKSRAADAINRAA